MTQDVEINAFMTSSKFLGYSQMHALCQVIEAWVKIDTNWGKNSQSKPLRHLLKSHQSAVDLGYPQREVSTKKGDANLLFGQNLPKTTWKWRKRRGTSKILLCGSATANKILSHNSIISCTDLLKVEFNTLVFFKMETPSSNWTN